MTSFIPTPEQAAIIEEVRVGKTSLLVNALAGAAKTTTLVRAAQKLPLVPTLSLQFNKRNAEEAKKRFPSHIDVKTLNALGHGVWGRKLSRKLVIDKDKMYDLTAARMESLKGEDKSRFGEAFSSILRATRMAKMAGYVPHSEVGGLANSSLADPEDLIEVIAPHVDVEPDDWFIAQVDHLLDASIVKAYEGLIDFDDQVYMSTLFAEPQHFQKFAIVLGDEVQDWSPLNHRAVERLLAPGGRLIAVGDPFQAIYGFRGAHQSSMEWLRSRFSMKTMTLSTSFRCPIEVILRARSRAPNMQWPEWAKPGIVEHLNEWTIADVPDGAAVISRNNAPLFRMALRFLRAGRSVKILGADIGKSLIKIMLGLGAPTMSQAEATLALKAWRDEQLRKAHPARHGPIEDRYACVSVFLEASATLREAVAQAEHVFSQDGRVLFMTGHKAKGDEFPIVFHLDAWLIPSKWAREAADEGDPRQLEQEKNLKYVIETRSQEALYLINTDDMKVAA